MRSTWTPRYMVVRLAALPIIAACLAISAMGLAAPETMRGEYENGIRVQYTG